MASRRATRSKAPFRSDTEIARRLFGPASLQDLLRRGGDDFGVTRDEAGANYLLTQVLVDEPTATIHQVGRYIDRFVESDGGLLLEKRICVYDDALIDNALVLRVRAASAPLAGALGAR